MVSGVWTLVTPSVVLPLTTLPSISAWPQAFSAPVSRTNSSNVIGSMRTGSAILRSNADNSVNWILSGRGFNTAALTNTRSDLLTTICEMAGMATRKLIAISICLVFAGGLATHKTGRKIARKMTVTKRCRHQNRFQWRWNFSLRFSFLVSNDRPPADSTCASWAPSSPLDINGPR